MSKFKKIDCEIKIDKIEFPNIGIGLYEDKKISIKNTIPGQTVATTISKKRKKLIGTRSVVVKKADYEIEPKCKDFLICGGCTFQNITYDKELEIKEKMVLELFHNDNIEYKKYDGINPSPKNEEYRNKMEYSFGDEIKDGPLALGMRRVNSFYEVVTSSHCNIVDEDYRKILNITLDFFRNTDEKFYHKALHTGALRHLLVRKGYFTGEILVGLVTTSEIGIDVNLYKDELLKNDYIGDIKGICHIVNNGLSDVVKADEFYLLYGDDFFYDKLLGLKFKITPFSFFQTNSVGAEKLYSTIIDYLGNVEGKRIFDLYSGTGTIGQIVASGSNAKEVIGIEIVEEAVIAANENAKLNNIKNAQFIAGDVFEQLNNIDVVPDVIILDPPRDGISSKSLEKIIDYGVKKIVYVSCKPSSLVRDLKVFIDNGYVVERMGLQDMFPRTYHVETVCLLSLK